MTTARSEKMARPAFRRDVQGLRAVAVTIVVLYHAGLSFPGGFIGVDVFFVLSGFVIMRGLLFELEQTGRIDLKAFALRRIRRLLPAFALLLVVVVPVGLFIAPVGGFSIGSRTAAAAAVFNANNLLMFTGKGYFTSSSELNPFLHTWSLSVEEQFYLVFPTALFVSWRLGVRLGMSGRRAIIAVLVVGGIASLVVAELLVSTELFAAGTFGERIAFYSAPTRAWEFGAGALVAFVGSPRRASRFASAAATLLGLGLLGVCSFVYASPGTDFPGLAAAAPVGATVLLLWAGEQGPLRKALGSRIFQWLGELSYGWYLWHWPLIVYARALTVHSEYDSRWVSAAAALFALVPAELSMRLLENPIRFSRTLTPLRVAVLGAACLAVPAAVSLASASAWNEMHKETLAAFDTSFAMHADFQLGCNLGGNQEVDRATSCDFLVASPAGRAVLVGDSNAGHFSEGAIGGMARIGFDLEIDTMEGCMFAAVVTSHRGTQKQDCADYFDAMIARLLKEQVDLVMIGHAGDDYIADSLVGVLDEASGQLVHSVDEKRDRIAEGLARAVSVLRSADIDVVVMQPVPRPRGWEPAACSIARWGADSDSCDVRIHPEDLARSRSHLALLNQRIEAAGAAVLDVSDQWCDAEECATRFGGQHLFRDETHITVAASRALVGQFAQLGGGTEATRRLNYHR